MSEKKITSNPCREFDLTIAIIAKTKKIKLKILKSDILTLNYNKIDFYKYIKIL